MPEKPPIATHEEVLELLTAKAREGSATAMVALERALRAETERDDLEREFDDLLAK